MYFFKKSGNLSQTHAIRLHRKYEESNFKIKDCLPRLSVFSLMCYTALSESSIATAAREGVFNITADSPTSLLWENAMIIHSGRWEKRPPPSHAMHQGDSICKKRQENVVCVWESPSWANNSVRVERVVRRWLQPPAPRGCADIDLLRCLQGAPIAWNLWHFSTHCGATISKDREMDDNMLLCIPLHVLFYLIYFFYIMKKRAGAILAGHDKKRKRESASQRQNSVSFGELFCFLCLKERWQMSNVAVFWG